MSVPDRLDLLAECDPRDIQRLFEQDDIVWAYRTLPEFVMAEPLVEWHSNRRAELTSTQLQEYILGFKTALGLRGWHPEFMRAMRYWLQCCEEERITRNRRRIAPRKDEEWLDADLRAEVEAVAGTGRHAGGEEYWFRCPWHEGDNTPSLHVHTGKKAWHCFGCGKHGGVYAWRQLTKGSSA